MPSIADILIEQGRVLADQRLRTGARRGALVTGLGQIPVQIMADRQAAREAARVAAERHAAAQQEAELKHAAEQRAQADLVLRQNADARAQAAVDQPRLDEERGRNAVMGWMKQHAATLKPDEADRMTAIMQMPGGTKHLVEQLSKAPEPFTLNPGDVRYDAAGTQIAANPKQVEPKPLTFSAPQPVMVGGRRTLARAGSDGALYDMRGQKIDNAQPDVPPSTAQGPQPGYQWIIRNGKQVYTNRVQEGDVPASRTGGGRNVTSGDASDLADFDTSLDDLKVLRDTVAPLDPKTGKPLDSGATGTSAKIGAMLPNAVTDLTGWGTEAKQKQAVIDRVKQVIGKTLEGGVLRKEDEAKYEKILPTIADTAAVVRKKLDGLDAAIAKRKQRRLDALADAGYDVTKYQGRTGPAAPAGGSIIVTAPDGSKHPFDTQAQADAFKKLAGIN